MLDRPENQWAVEGFHINAAIDQPALTAPLPTGRQAVRQRQTSLPSIETDGLTEEQPGHHPGQENQVTSVAGGAVLTQEACELSMDPGVGIHEGLDWCRNPKLSRLPAHPIS